MQDFKFQPSVSLVSKLALAASQVIAIPIDARQFYRSYLKARVLTGAAVSGTFGVQCDLHSVINREATTAALIVGATSVTVSLAFAAFIMVGDQLVIENEVVTVSAVNTGTGVVTVSACANAHAVQSWMYLIPTIPGSTWTVGAGTATTNQGVEQIFGNGDYVLVATNLDASHGVTFDVAWSKL